MILLIGFALGYLCMGSEFVAANDPSVPYLKYQEPQPATTSWLSTGVYIFSLLATFTLILGLAYFASRFLGHKFSQNMGLGDSTILSTLILGPNRAVYVVEIAGKILVLGVTEQQITLLQEIHSVEEIAKLRAKNNSSLTEPFHSVFRQQLASLQQMTNKFPAVFGTNSSAERERSDTQEKR
ncbi:MAG TPA: flagellar biosynthetic protein FliO [Patescibacteria group bacterium]|nr:flagellar biosynthetic protein FliO [Patescibacteria group bacterium]